MALVLVVAATPSDPQALLARVGALHLRSKLRVSPFYRRSVARCQDALVKVESMIVVDANVIASLRIPGQHTGAIRAARRAR